MMSSTLGLPIYFAFFLACTVSASRLSKWEKINEETQRENDLQNLVKYLAKRVKHPDSKDQQLTTDKRWWNNGQGWGTGRWNGWLNVKNYCEDEPCAHGVCWSKWRGYSCHCDDDWTGRNCDEAIEVNECDDDTCAHGDCIQGYGEYTCVCQPGWTGEHCETEEKAFESTTEAVTEIVTEGGPEKRCNVTSCVHGLCEKNECKCDAEWIGTTCDRFSPCLNASVSGKFYFAHSDIHCFIQCDEFGKTYEHCCPAQMVWSQKNLACNVMVEKELESEEIDQQIEDPDKEIDDILEEIEELEEEIGIYEEENGGPDNNTDAIEQVIDEIVEDIDDDQQVTSDGSDVIETDEQTQEQSEEDDNIEDIIKGILEETSDGSDIEEENENTSLEKELQNAKGNKTIDIVNEEIEEINTEINIIEQELEEAIEGIIIDDNSTETDTEVDIQGNGSDIIEEIEEVIGEIEDEKESQEAEENKVGEPIITTVKAPLSRCPDASKTDGRLRTFRGVCYQFVEEEVKWVDAEETCRMKGGSLVQIRNRQTQDWLYNTLTGDLEWRFNGLWIGATDQDSERTWLWVTGDKLKWTNWASGNPSWLSGDCANFRLDDGGKWEDKFCSSFLYKYSFVCQYDMIPVTTTSTTTPFPEPTTIMTTETPTTENVLTAVPMSTTPEPEPEVTPNMTTEKVTSGSSSPCTEEAIKEGILYHPYPGDPTRFISCDEWGQKFIKHCPKGTVWLQSKMTCGANITEAKRHTENHRRLLRLKKLLSEMDKY